MFITIVCDNHIISVPDGTYEFKPYSTRNDFFNITVIRPYESVAFFPQSIDVFYGAYYDMCILTARQILDFFLKIIWNYVSYNGRNLPFIILIWN